MAFTVTPVGSPAPVPGALTNSQAAARERVIAKLSTPEPTQTTPVQNPSKVSPEEMGAVKAPETRQNDSIEPPKEATTTPKTEETPLSAQYARLARQEKAIRAQVQALKTERDAFKAQQDALQPKPETRNSNDYIPKDRLIKETLAVLAEQGISYDQLSQQALSAPTQAEIVQQQVIAELKAEIQAIKDGQEKSQKNIEETQKQSYTQAVNQIRTEAKRLISSDPNFETIQGTGSVEDVVELITKTFQADGVLLTIEEAALAVEEHLVEEAVKIARLTKIQKRLQPATPAEAPKAAGSQEKSQIKTLTNAQGVQRQLTAKERALKAFKGESF